MLYHNTISLHLQFHYCNFGMNNNRMNAEDIGGPTKAVQDGHDMCLGWASNASRQALGQIQGLD